MKWIFYETNLIVTRGHRLPRLLLHFWSFKNEKLLPLLPYTVSQKLSEQKNRSKTFSTRMWVCASVFECARVFFGCNWSKSNMCVLLRSVNFFRVCVQCCKQTNSLCSQQARLPTLCQNSYFEWVMTHFLLWNFPTGVCLRSVTFFRVSAFLLAY